MFLSFTRQGERETIAILSASDRDSPRFIALIMLAGFRYRTGRSAPPHSFRVRLSESSVGRHIFSGPESVSPLKRAALSSSLPLAQSHAQPWPKSPSHPFYFYFYFFLWQTPALFMRTHTTTKRIGSLLDHPCFSPSLRLVIEPFLFPCLFQKPCS